MADTPHSPTTVELQKRRSAGSSMWEAAAWMIAFYVAQALALSALLTLIYVSAFGMQWIGSEALISWIIQTDLDRSFLLIAVPVTGAVFLLLPLIRLREGRAYRDVIGWRVPRVDELIFAFATVVPISMIGNLVYRLFQDHWPHLGPLAYLSYDWVRLSAVQSNSLEALHQAFTGVPIPILLVSMALAPAFIEELIFRGVIGRRLVNRYGTMIGIITTSMAFAILHGSALHAVATLPIGILLHILYLKTGTIWVPILVHFCNNSLAIISHRFSLQESLDPTPYLMAAMTLYLCMMVVMLSIRNQQHHSFQ